MSARPVLRLLGVLAFGLSAVAATALLIATLQQVLENFGYPLPRIVFLGVLGAGVVYVALWAMGRFAHALETYRVHSSNRVGK